MSYSWMAELRWLERREPGLVLSERSSVRLLDFLDDRWIISIPPSGPPTIWDTREEPPKLREPTSRSFWDAIWSATVAVDPHQGDIVIGLWK